MARTVLVTGASRGIGREVARELAVEGYRVLLGVRTEASAPAFEGSVPEVVDLSAASSIEALVARLTKRREKLDALVNNAAINLGSRRDLWNVNVRGPMLLTQALEPLLADGARVVMVSSGMGRKSAQSRALRERLAAITTLAEFDELCDDAPGDYGSTKAALNRLSELFADALAPRGILVNAISPGWVRTDMGGSSAPRSLEQGAASVLWGVRLAKDGPKGGFFEDGERIRD